MTSPPVPAAAPPLRLAPGPLQRLYRFLVSPKLAIALLLGVLACCVVGVLFFTQARSWEIIFGTLWFNALLVLLAVSSATAFFTRIWRRRLTLVSAGMILFHVSFAALLGGVVFNSLFHFRGVLRLTEGETLPNGEPGSYDLVEHGRLFRFTRLRGETTLVRMFTRYTVDGQDKRAAYEIAVGQGDRAKKGTIYVTQDLVQDGVRYLCSKEGYSVLLVLDDKDGHELYGAHVPLQSLQQPDGSYVYATGSAHGASPFVFPPPPEQRRGSLLMRYRPSAVADREGEVTFQVWPLGAKDAMAASRSGRVTVGKPFDAGDFILTPREIRYWVGMDVRYDPGKTVILGSLCLGMAGMTLTLAGRLRQGSARRRTAKAH